MQFKECLPLMPIKEPRGYLRTQKTYEILRTVLYFCHLCLCLSPDGSAPEAVKSPDHRGGTGMSSGLQESGRNVHVPALPGL